VNPKIKRFWSPEKRQYLFQCSITCLCSSKRCRKRNLDGKCFLVENTLFQKGNMLIVFTFGVIRVLFNHYCVENLTFKVVNIIPSNKHRIKADTAGRKYYCGFTRRHTQLSLRQPYSKWSPWQQVLLRTKQLNSSNWLI
jgi:hypothetical protein